MNHRLKMWLILSLVILIIGTNKNEVFAEDMIAMEQVNQNVIVTDENGCLPLSNMDCDEDIVDKFVPAGTLCFHVREPAGPDLFCVNGEWVKATSLDANVNRVRRSHESCTIVRSRSRRWTRRRRRRSKTVCTAINHAPYFDNCPSSLTFTTPAGKTTMPVSWVKPTAHDLENGERSVKQTSGPNNGDTLTGSANGISYYVYYISGPDAQGLTAKCLIQLIVKVTYCPTPTVPMYGSIDCTGLYNGHSCTFTCEYGYVPTVTSMICQANGQWTNGGLSECSGTTCPFVLPEIEHGHYPYSDNIYGTTSYPECGPGYSVSVNFPITCKNDGQWSVPIGTICKDSDPPTILHCPSDLQTTAEIGTTSAVVTWDVPSASDKQDTDNPVVTQTAGSIQPGSLVETGFLHTIKYVAYDLAENPSEECSFTVRVFVTKCSSLSAPINGQYLCDKGFIYGSECSFTCNQGYGLQGVLVTSCGQNGDWSSSSPTCAGLQCLQPEQYGLNISNGYFSCPSPITYQSACNPVCNSGFTLTKYSSAICIVDSNNSPLLSLSSQPECLDNEPPTFDDCPGTKVLTFPAEKGKTSATIHYDVPTASDNVDPSPKVTKKKGPNNGDVVDANDIEYVEFQATDSSNNNSSLCLYVLQVDVTECSAYIPPENGEVTCTAEYIYGSICTLTCKDGYEGQGSERVECLESGSWDVTDFECTKVLCPSLPVPPGNGYYTCAANTYPYGTICQANCNNGFSVSQWSYAQCKADKTWEKSTTPNCIDSEPPVITNCQSEVNVNAERGLESAVVTWVEPSASDNVDINPTVTRTSGPKPGDRIEGNAVVKYKSTDAAGNPSDICTLYINVQVIRCSSPYWPDDGRVSCNLGFIYGSECTYTCDEGYEVSSPSIATCDEDGSWSYGIQPPTCSPIRCDPPASVPNGHFSCADIMYLYQSFCILQCDSGYTTDKAVYATCKSTGEWSISSNTNCKDITPPTLLKCITHQTFYTDRGADSAQVIWSIPRAIDNVDDPQDINIEKLSGPELNSSISIGATVVDYRAVDTAGNPSLVSCSITINVEAVICNHPKYYFDDSNLEYDCTSFDWGDTCYLSCPLNDSLILKGPALITCEATFSGSSPITAWEYDGNVEPLCEAQVCPSELNVPQNGALVYEQLNSQPVVFVLCNKNYDLPYEFDGLVICLDSGQWNAEEIPDCTRTRRPGLNLLPLSFTYSGDCSSPTTENAIKDQVFEILEEYRGTALAPDCLDGSMCSYDDLVVECGETLRKRRDLEANNRYKKHLSYIDTINRYERQKNHMETHNLYKRQESEVLVSFSLTLTGFVANFSQLLDFEDALIEMSNKLEVAVATGSFNSPDFSVIQGSYQRAEYSEQKCEGSGQVREAFQCKSCAVGMFLQDVDGAKKCLKCPIGTYAENESSTSCTSCPPGTSTNRTGAKSADMCAELCPIGFYSTTLVKPCTPCAIGFYQESVGQATCQQCDFGKTTFKVGSNSCTSFEIALNSQSRRSIISPLQMGGTTEEMTVLFWLFRRSGSEFSLRIGDDVIIEVLEDSFFFKWNNESISKLIPGSSFDKWAHFAVSTSTTLSFYYNGKILDTQEMASTSTVPANANVELVIDGEIDIYLNSLAIYSRLLSNDEISNHKSSCDYDMSSADLTSDDLINDNPWIQAEPSSCTATDFCADEPCGQHLCKNTKSKPVCTCLGGFTGTRCEVAPDNCDPNECQNEATCVSNNNNYTCVCKPGFRGVFCQTPPINGGWSPWSSWGHCSSSCDGGIRQRNRTCDNPSPDQYGANCVGDMTEDVQCNTDPCSVTYPCFNQPCGSHGGCEEVSGNFVCHCKSGFTGALCQTPISHCDPSPCKNGGSCQDGAENFTCICNGQFRGELCEEVINSTSYWTPWSSCTVSCGGGISSRSRVCLTNVNCTDQIQSRVCNSVPCVADFCQSSPCGTHQCISRDNDFKCICDVGYTGMMCDTAVNYCETNSCENGLCKNTITGYECVCETGYGGYFCDVLNQNAGWGLWSEWSDCTATCGPGLRNRNRTCDNPPPIPGDETCEGEGQQSESCYTNCSDACSSGPCGDIHTCIADNNRYKCKCKNGYSGDDCSVAADYCQPNPCENSGECASTSDGFICTCVDGYSGPTCDVIADKSVWQPWSIWGPCSVTCDGGKESRYRECRRGTKGDDCSGENTEERQCAKDSCPTCKRLGRFYGIHTRCKKVDEMTTCTLTCYDEYYPPNSTYSSENWTLIYQCSPFSSYAWNLTNFVPSCSSTRQLPVRINALGSVGISPQISCGQASAFETSARNIAANSVCLRGTTCSAAAEVSRCSNRKKRQTSEEDSEVTFTFSFDFDNETNSGSNNITEYWGIIEDSLSPFTTNSGDWLAVEIDGVTYIADTSNITKGATLECSAGYFLQDKADICVGCSPGTMYDASNDYCIPCPLGTYQELAAQNWCVPCPEGYTTNTTGSYDQQDCYYLGEETADTSDVIIGAAVGGSVFAVLVAVSVVAIIKIRSANKKSRINISTVDLHKNRNERFWSRQTTSTSIKTTSNIPVSLQEID